MKRSNSNPGWFETILGYLVIGAVLFFVFSVLGSACSSIGLKPLGF